jgi:uncharacterized membrane protein YcaP (DUF421 family)
MYTIFRGIFIYVILLIVFRIAGKRTLAQITTFDFVLLLIISEVVQQAMIASDNSVMNAILLVLTLIGLDVLISLIKQRSPAFAKLVDSMPVVLIENGRMMKDRMDKARVDEDDILSSARHQEGLERLDQIKYAVLERSGGISVVPKEEQKK